MAKREHTGAAQNALGLPAEGVLAQELRLSAACARALGAHAETGDAIARPVCRSYWTGARLERQLRASVVEANYLARLRDGSTTRCVSLSGFHSAINQGPLNVDALVEAATGYHGVHAPDKYWIAEYADATPAEREAYANRVVWERLEMQRRGVPVTALAAMPLDAQLTLQVTATAAGLVKVNTTSLVELSAGAGSS